MVVTFADELAAASIALDRALADRYGTTAVTADVGAPVSLALAPVTANGSRSHNPIWHPVDVTPEMVAAVDAYLDSKTDDERAAIAALLEVA